MLKKSLHLLSYYLLYFTLFKYTYYGAHLTPYPYNEKWIALGPLSPYTTLEFSFYPSYFSTR